MKPKKIMPSLAALAFGITSSHGAITVVSTSTGLANTVRSTAAGNSSFSISFDAGATADAIVLALSSESNATAGKVAITYAGFAFTPVIDHVASQPSVWLLNLSDTTYISGSANLILDLTGVTTANGYGLGFVSVATNDALNDRLAVHDTNTTSGGGPGAPLTVGLATTLESFVIAGHRSNNASGGATASAPMTQLYGNQIGSSQGAAGYQASVPAGSPVFTFASADQARNSSAAAFVPVPEPSAALLGSLGLLALLRRRRN